MTLRKRDYQADRDLQRVTELLHATWTPRGPLASWHIGDVSWWARRKWDFENIFWEDRKGQVVGFADHGPGGGFELLVRADVRETQLHQWMLNDIEEVYQGLPPEEQVSELETRITEGDEAAATFLEQYGYVRLEDAAPVIHMLRSLEEPVEEAILPPGYYLRALAGDADVEPRVMIHNISFEGTLQPEGYRIIRGLATYRQELDLVVVDLEGQFVASCIGWMDDTNRVGQFEPVGTHPLHRRKGLGKAVLVEGMRRMREQGAAIAYIKPEHGQEHLIDFYSTCGFREVGRHVSFAKTV